MQLNPRNHHPKMLLSISQLHCALESLQFALIGITFRVILIFGRKRYFLTVASFCVVTFCNLGLVHTLT